MSSNNNDNSGAIMVFALIGAALCYLAIFLIAFAVVVAIIFTVIAIAAWNRPLRVGKMVVTPEEARDFVRRGLFGMWAMPVFCSVADLILATNIASFDTYPYLMLGGYILGSLGVEMLLNGDGDREPGRPLIEYLPPPQQQPSRENPEPRTMLPAPAREPFRFASWDDEEDRR